MANPVFINAAYFGQIAAVADKAANRTFSQELCAIRADEYIQERGQSLRNQQERLYEINRFMLAYREEYGLVDSEYGGYHDTRY